MISSCTRWLSTIFSWTRLLDYISSNHFSDLVWPPCLLSLWHSRLLCIVTAIVDSACNMRVIGAYSFIRHIMKSVCLFVHISSPSWPIMLIEREIVAEEDELNWTFQNKQTKSSVHTVPQGIKRHPRSSDPNDSLLPANTRKNWFIYKIKRERR